ncbi:polymorphic toxin-type HINT domain-containing protein [Couchioplanes azureus]|uniref:polymorphic toxin-type HINT domain-containing protein n=1 Tax=Couchioplanes caeruleus TaxID=56438 RepID=UPI0016711C11|nr:polymorphic toxin-type HINT domain-containing protein [Couchioplanes caeruleus]GGQ83684.1 hypothetical protein GCM10010166_62320 [Couchioplanes caeruleus subsp. azureus]
MKRTLLASVLVVALLVGYSGPALAVTPRAKAASAASAGASGPRLGALQKCADAVLNPGVDPNTDGLLQKLARLSQFHKCATDAGFSLAAALNCVDKVEAPTLSARYQRIKQCLADTGLRVGSTVLQATLLVWVVNVFRSGLPQLTADVEAILSDVRGGLSEAPNRVARLQSLLAEQRKVTDPKKVVPGLLEALRDATAYSEDLTVVGAAWSKDLADRRERQLSAADTIRYVRSSFADVRDALANLLPTGAELSAGFKSTVAKLTAATKAVEDVLQAFVDSANLLREFNKTLDEANKSVAGANKALKKMDSALKDVNRSLVGLKQGIDEANRGMDEANRGIAQAIQGMDEMNRALVQMNKGLAQMNGAVAAMPDVKALLGSGISLKGAMDRFENPFGETLTPEQHLARLQESEHRDAMMSLLLDLTPGIGDGKGVLDAIHGRDIATGQELSGPERALSAAFLLHYLKGLRKVGDVAGVTGKLNKATQSLRKAQDGVKALRYGKALPATWVTRTLTSPPAGVPNSAGVTWTEAVLKDGGGRLVYSSDGRIYAETGDGLHYIGARERGAVGEACLNSFRPDTPVLMGDGSRRAIADVRPGDSVLAGHPVSGMATPKAVTAVHAHRDTALTDVTVTGADGNQHVVHTTDEHPFWVARLQEWVDAEDLTVGTRLSTPDNGEVTVAAVRSFAGDQIMDNLTVADLHTYYVAAGDEAVLVHNCPMARDGRSLGSVNLPRTYGGVDMEHVKSGHFVGGARVRSRSDLWPAGTTEAEVERVAAAAFRNSPRKVGYDSNNRMIQAQARVDGKLYEFIINRDTGIIRSIYPQ